MAYLKLSDLKGACVAQRALFKEHFGTGGEVTLSKVLSVADVFDWSWAAEHLLSPSTLAECEKARATAWAEYNKVRATAWAEYNKVCAPAWAECEKVRATALAEHNKVRATAWAKYDKTCATAWAKYDKTCATAWFKGWEADHT